MILKGLFRFFLFLSYRLFKDDLFLIHKAKSLPRVPPQDLKLVFRILRKLSVALPIHNRCFILSLTMFSLCGEGATLYFGVSPAEPPLCHAWVKWQESEFNMDYGFQGSVLWTHSK